MACFFLYHPYGIFFVVSFMLLIYSPYGTGFGIDNMYFDSAEEFDTRTYDNPVGMAYWKSQINGDPVFRIANVYFRRDGSSMFSYMTIP